MGTVIGNKQVDVGQGSNQLVQRFDSLITGENKVFLGDPQKVPNRSQNGISTPDALHRERLKLEALYKGQGTV